MEEIRTKEFTAKDMFNAATATPLKTMIGKVISVAAIWVCERPDNDGVVQVVANIKSSDGTIYGTISETVIRSVLAMPEMLEEMSTIDIKVEERAGNKGRSYLVIQLV